MKKLIGPVAGAALAVSFGVATTVHAEESDVYVGASVGGYALDVDDVDFDEGSRFLRAYAGLNFTDNLAVEGDYTRLLEADDTIDGTAAEFEADAFSVFLRPKVSLSEHVDIYGKVGNSGVSIATLDDMKVLYQGFDLCDPSTSVSM